MGLDRFAYAAVVGIGTTSEEGLRRASLAADYIGTSPVVAERFTNPPGCNSLATDLAMLKAGGRRGGFVRDRHGNPVERKTASIEQFIESGTCFAGTVDDVYEQIKALSDSVGGFGHLLMFGQGGFFDHEGTVANIALVAREVMPRLRELNAEPQRAAGSGSVAYEYQLNYSVNAAKRFSIYSADAPGKVWSSVRASALV